jgi:hypothetical protein
MFRPQHASDYRELRDIKKLTIVQLIKTFSAFYGSPEFITAVTTALYRILS